MANRFIAPAEVSASSVASGGSVKVTLKYDYVPRDPQEEHPVLKMTHSSGFVVTGQKVTLEPAINGSVEVELRIVRTTSTSHDCTMTFEALNDERNVAVAVT